MHLWLIHASYFFTPPPPPPFQSHSHLGWRVIHGMSHHLSWQKGNFFFWRCLLNFWPLIEISLLSIHDGLSNMRVKEDIMLSNGEVAS